MSWVGASGFRGVVCVATMLVGVCLGVGEARAAQILLDPGFESGALSPNWIPNTNGVVTTSANVHSGAYAVQSGANTYFEQAIASTPTAQITELSFWLQQDTGAFAMVHLIYSDASSENVVINDPATGWFHADITSDLDSGKALTAFWVFGASSLGVPDTTFDDFVLDVTEAQAVPEPVSVGLMLTGILGVTGARMAKARRRA